MATDGDFNLDAMLSRKPLQEAEQRASPTQFCVTGGAGYIGSRIVARLLACKHTVHATKRAVGDDESAVAALNRLPGAAKRLRWFDADLTQPGSFDAAVQGCQYVIHAAGIVTFNAGMKEAYGRLIRPTVQGVENVLAAVNRSPTVQKVVLTSSLAAVSADFPHPGHVYTEADWTTNFLELEEPYVASKLLSEWQAWAAAGQQTRWRLVSICPAHVYGPPVTANLKSAPVAVMKCLLDGSWWPLTAPNGLGIIDLDDVAAAHVLAAVLPQAQGRYLLCERFTLMSDMAALLRKLYPAHWVPHVILPFWISAVILVLLNVMSLRWVKVMWRQHAEVDCSKARRELGMDFIPMERSLQDFAERLLELGAVPRLPLKPDVSNNKEPQVKAGKHV